MAVPWLGWLVTSFSLWRSVFSSRPGYRGFVVDKGALG